MAKAKQHTIEENLALLESKLSTHFPFVSAEEYQDIWDYFIYKIAQGIEHGTKIDPNSIITEIKQLKSKSGRFILSPSIRQYYVTH